MRNIPDSPVGIILTTRDASVNPVRDASVSITQIPPFIVLKPPPDTYNRLPSADKISERGSEITSMRFTV